MPELTEENPIQAMFDALGVPTFDQWLRNPDWTILDHDDVTGYASIAAIRWNGPTSVDTGERVRDLSELHDLFALFLIRALSGELVEQDGRIFMDVSDVITDAGPIEVTEAKLRHWEWMMRLLSEKDRAHEYLALAPERVRLDAMDLAAQRNSERFDELVSGLRTDA